MCGACAKTGTTDVHQSPGVNVLHKDGDIERDGYSRIYTDREEEWMGVLWYGSTKAHEQNIHILNAWLSIYLTTRMGLATDHISRSSLLMSNRKVHGWLLPWLNNKVKPSSQGVARVQRQEPMMFTRAQVFISLTKMEIQRKRERKHIEREVPTYRARQIWRENRGAFWHWKYRSIWKKLRSQCWNVWLKSYFRAKGLEAQTPAWGLVPTSSICVSSKKKQEIRESGSLSLSSTFGV